MFDMIPCRLTLYREKRAVPLDIDLLDAYGQAEHQPIAGKPFIMMDNDGTTIKTGFISTIEWFGYQVGGKYDFDRCYFYTDNSTYRWEKLSESNENAAPENKEPEQQVIIIPD